MSKTESLAEGDQAQADTDARLEPVAQTVAAETQLGPADSRAETTRTSLRARTDGPGETGVLWKAVAALGWISLLGAVAVVAMPETFGTGVQFTTETVRALRSLGLLLGAFVGIFGLYVAYHRDVGDADSTGTTSAVELPAADPEESHGPTTGTVGVRLDQQLDTIDGLVDGGTKTHYAAYMVEQNLRALAIRVVADAADCSHSRAREHVDQGTWTDDVRAAAFLGDSAVPDRTLGMRIRDWANGSTYDRQVVATVDEIAALEAGEWS